VAGTGGRRGRNIAWGLVVVVVVVVVVAVRDQRGGFESESRREDRSSVSVSTTATDADGSNDEGAVVSVVGVVGPTLIPLDVAVAIAVAVAVAVPVLGRSHDQLENWCCVKRGRLHSHCRVCG